ncbi:MAG TPA: L,D-transpeptidase [Gaiellaceae bacterium]|jgi:hypothetical protein|nr:L,D-transpeptidase [Gaiellaceae bacterium]
MRRAPLVSVLILAAAGAATARADDPPVEPPPPVIAAGVTVAGVDVGGLTRPEAVDVLEGWFARPIPLRFRDRRHLRARPTVDLRAQARIWPAVTRALTAPSGTDVRLYVRQSNRALRRFSASVAKRLERKPRSAVLTLSRSLRPRVSKARAGRRVKTRRLRLDLRSAVATHSRAAVWVRTRTIRPTATRRSIGPTVVIRRGSKRLSLFRGVRPRGNMRLRATFGVATGLPQYPTPLGRFTIASMQRNPWWYPPDSDWAAGAQPIPPGPGNPLGTRWMGLSVGGVGIHGTPDAASIGYSASHGCIRMRIREAEWLFERVRIGTTVFIVGA